MLADLNTVPIIYMANNSVYLIFYTSIVIHRRSREKRDKNPLNGYITLNRVRCVLRLVCDVARDDLMHFKIVILKNNKIVNNTFFISNRINAVSSVFSDDFIV